jgi:hypothetical protein
MIIEELLTLFDKQVTKKEWGAMTRIIFYSDGSGYVIDEDGDNLFDFDSVEELIEKLEKQT